MVRLARICGTKEPNSSQQERGTEVIHRSEGSIRSARMIEEDVHDCDAMSFPCLICVSGLVRAS